MAAAACHVSFDVGIRNLAVAVIYVSGSADGATAGAPASIRIVDWRVIDLLERTAASKIKNVDLARRLRLLHDECARVWAVVRRLGCEIVHVHVERQHARNHGMVAMAVGLFVEALVEFGASVAFVPAKEKLAYAARIVPDVATSADVAAARGKRNYAARKKLAVSACRAILARADLRVIDDDANGESDSSSAGVAALDRLNGADRRKLDDLADAMLQALARADVLDPLESGPTGTSSPKKRKRATAAKSKPATVAAKKRAR